MKMIVAVALALVAVAAAAPAAPGPDAAVAPQIVRSKFEQDPEGGYNFDFETEDGVKRGEIGELKVVPDEENKPRTVITVRGSYSYPGADGKPETVTYFADETGYHAEGDSIPKAVSRR